MDEIQFAVDLVSLAPALGGCAFGALSWMLGTLIFGRRYKQRIAALEAQIAGGENVSARIPTMQDVSIVLVRPDGTHEGYVNCRLTPPRPEDGAPSAQVVLGRRVIPPAST